MTILNNTCKYVFMLGVSLLSMHTIKANKLDDLLAKADSLQTAKSDSLLPVLYHCLEQIETGTPEAKVKVYFLLSNYFLRHEMSDSALKYCMPRLDLVKKYNKPNDIIMAKTDLGEIYGKKGEYKKAFRYLIEAMELSKSTQSRKVQAKLMASQAYLYYLFEKKQESIQLLKEALHLYTLEHDTVNMSYINNNLGILYKNQVRYDSALLYLERSYDLSGTLADTLGMASACNNMGNIYSLAQDLDNAAKYLEKSLYYYRALNRDEISLYSNLGRIYQQLGQSDKSLEYLKLALELSYFKGEPKKIMGVLQELSEFYREQEDWQMAFKYLNDYHQMKEKEYEDKLPDLINRIQADADLKIKEKTIGLLTEKNNYQALYIQQKNILIILLVLVLLTTIGLGAFWITHKRSETVKREVLMEQRLLRSQMNPHFFFNTLTMIQYYVLQNEAEQAGIFINKFAQLMREVLENSAKNKITLQKELSAMENYLSLQQLRMEHSFDYQLSVTDNISPETIEIPPMLFQPFIENAIDHGIKNLTGRRGMLEICIAQKDGFLQIVVRDNGVGRAKAAELNDSLRKHHKSMATKLTEERLNILYNNRKKRSQLNIKDLMDNSNQPAGTEVELMIAMK